VLSRAVDLAPNKSDDVGIARRIIPSLLEIDLESSLVAFSELSFEEEGSRRRVASALESREQEIVRDGMQEQALALADRCLDGSRGADWKLRCQEFRNRLRNIDPETGEE